MIVVLQLSDPTQLPAALRAVEPLKPAQVWAACAETEEYVVSYLKDVTP